MAALTDTAGSRAHERSTDHIAVAFRAGISMPSARTRQTTRASESMAAHSLPRCETGPHNPEVTGSNPVAATTNDLVRDSFGEETKGSRSFLAAIWQQTSRVRRPAHRRDNKRPSQ